MTYRPWNCPICHLRPVRVGCVTCTNSFCQEASYARNMMFASARKLKSAHLAALRAQDERATASARAWGRSR